MTTAIATDALLRNSFRKRVKLSPLVTLLLKNLYENFYGNMSISNKVHGHVILDLPSVKSINLSPLVTLCSLRTSKQST